MKLRYVMTAGLGALVLSCQGPAAVLAREAAANTGAAGPHAAFAAACERALEAAPGRPG